MSRGSLLQSLLPVVSRLLPGISSLFCFLFYSERWTEGGREAPGPRGWDQKVGCSSIDMTSWTFDCQESGVGVLTQTKAQWHHTKGILMSLLSNPKAGRLFPASLSTPSSKAASQLGAHSLPSCNFKMENTLPDTHSGRYIVLDR